MKTYKWDGMQEMLCEGGSEVLGFGYVKNADHKFVHHCGELLAKTLNEEQMWEEKKRLFVEAQTSKKETML